MPTCPDTVKRLIERFHQQSDQVCSPDYNETQVRIDFLDPFMSALGWDINNTSGHAEQYRDVVHEDSIKVAGQTKAPDYSFRVGGSRKFFLEAKKPAVKIKTSVEAAYQLRRYAWSVKLPVSILTDFQEFAVYDGRIRPKHLDAASKARREYFTYTDFEDKWDFFHSTFSKAAVYNGDFDRYADTQKGRGAQPPDDAFLEDIEKWREEIANNLALRNKTLDEPALNFAVQRIIDRIIFLRIAEDRGSEELYQLRTIANQKDAYTHLVTLFKKADQRYNSGLFHFQPEKGRNHAPDTLTPRLDLDNKTLKGIIHGLYYPESPYVFDEITADLLGSVYERFLGKVITLTDKHRARIEEKPEVRKAGGVYYTPTYIVDYIVQHTVGKLLENKTPQQAAKLKILDPACGSGSFLIGAYQFLLDWYLTQYQNATDPHTLATGNNSVLRPGPTGSHLLTIAERKRILLTHIHGVDLDAQAVEVSKLNLLLKCLEGETAVTLGFEQKLFRQRALPDLGHNIQCGNSLIATDIIGTPAWDAMTDPEREKLNPFDYENAFPDVFKNKKSGFDAVIGNPPYLNIRGLTEIQGETVKEFFAKNFRCAKKGYDLYVLFVEKALVLMKSGGLFGMIVPNKISTLDYAEACRKILVEGTKIISIADVSHLNVFKEASVYPYVIVAKPSSPTPSHKLTVIHARSPEILLSDNERTSLMQSDLDVVNGFSLHGVLDVESRVVTQPLTEIASISSGTTGFMATKTAQELKEISDDHDSFFPFIVTGNIDRYHVRLGDVRFIKRKFSLPGLSKRSALLSPAKRKLFAGEKLVIGGMTKRIEAHLDCLGCALGVNVYAVSEYTVDPRYLLGILNSNLISYLFRLRFQAKHLAGGFLAINKGQLAQLPIAVLDSGEDFEDEVAKMRPLVDSMLSLHRKLAAETLPQKRTQIQREIEATDRKIDQLVYTLYALTPEEITLVEAATAQP